MKMFNYEFADEIGAKSRGVEVEKDWKDCLRVSWPYTECYYAIATHLRNKITEAAEKGLTEIENYWFSEVMITQMYHWTEEVRHLVMDDIVMEMRRCGFYVRRSQNLYKLNLVSWVGIVENMELTANRR